MSVRALISSLLATSALSSAVLAAAPLNDNIGRAFGISGTNQTVRGENKGATRESWEAQYSGALQGKSVWWYLDAAESGRLTIKTEGSNFDTMLVAFTYVNGRFLPAAVNDNAGNGISWSQLSISAQKGTRYYIAVDGAGGAEGQIVLSINRGEGAVKLAGATTYPSTATPPTATTSAPAVSSTKSPSAPTPKATPAPKVSSTIQGPIPPTVITIGTSPSSAFNGPTPDDYIIGTYGATINNGTDPLNLTWDTAFDLNDPTLTGLTRRRGSPGEVKMLITGKSKWTGALESWQTSTSSPFSRIRHVTGVNLFVGYGVWWKWTAPEDGTASFDTRGTECTTTLHVFDRDTRTAVYTSNATTVTCTLTDHGLAQNASIRRSIRILTPAQWAGKHEVTATGPNTFTFPNSNPAVTSVAIDLSDQIQAFSGYTPLNVGFANARVTQGVQQIAYTSTETTITGTLVGHNFPPIFWMTIIEPKQWAGLGVVTRVDANTFTFPNPNPTANGTLMCLLTDLSGGIASNPYDGRRLLAMNDNSAPGMRSSYVRLLVAKGNTYWVGVDVDQARTGTYAIVTTNNIAGTVPIGSFGIGNVNVGKINLSFDFIPQPRGGPSTKSLVPVVTSQPTPASRMVNADANATFTATAMGTQPITYQWRLNGVPVVGNTTANNSTLIVSGAHPMHLGSYTLKVTDLFGTVISSPATLGMNGYPIAITTQPNNATVNNGTAASFSVVVNNNATYNLQPFTYKWYRNNGTTTLLSNNATALASNTLTVSPATPADIGAYYVVVSDRYYNTIYESNATSSNATLLIGDYPFAITTQPNNATVNNGTAATFNVTVNSGNTYGLSSFNYKWYKNNGTTTLVSDVNSTVASGSYTILTASPADIGDYYVIVKDAYAGTIYERNATSSNATLSISDYPIVINTHPSNQTITSYPSNATFTVAATGVAPITYQWYKNNGTTTLLAGEISSTLIVVNATPADTGVYYAIVKDGFAATSYETNATSNNATLSFPNYPLTITTHPSNATVTVGNNATFTVIANGTTPITYQWYKDNGTVTAVGGNSATLSVNNATISDAGTYYVIARDGFISTAYESNATSNNGTLTVNP